MIQDVNEGESLFEAGAVTIDGAIAEFGFGRSELYAEMRAGRLAFVQRGRRRLIPRKALRRNLAELMATTEGHQS